MAFSLGIAGEAYCFHSRAVSSVINGERAPGPDSRGVFKQVPGLNEEVHLECVWDPEPENAHMLAAQFGIPRVAASSEELCESVDAVMILGDRDMQFQRFAPTFIRRGLPCYVDKPLSPDIAEAREITELARTTGTPFFSSSPARFAPQLVSFRSEMAPKIGDLLSMSLVGPGELVFYGIHLVDFAISVLGPEVKSVWNVGKPGNELLAIDYGDNRTVSVAIVSGAQTRFHVLATGTNGWEHIYIDNYGDYFAGLVRAVGQMARTRVPPVPLDEVIRAIEVLEAARRSRATGRPIELPVK